MAYSSAMQLSHSDRAFRAPVLFLSCGLFPVKEQLTMLSSETQISGQIWKAKQILLPFGLSPREPLGWKKSHHKAFPPIQTLSKFGNNTPFFILCFRLVKVEVFSPPLNFTRSIMLPAWNSLPHPFMKTPPTSLQSTPTAMLPLLFLQGHCSPENVHYLGPDGAVFTFSH